MSKAAHNTTKSVSRISASDRLAAVKLVLGKKANVTDVSRQYGVARKTVYQWLKKYDKNTSAGKVGQAAVADEYVSGADHPLAKYPQLEESVLAQVAGNPSQTIRDLSSAAAVSTWTMWQLLSRHGLNTTEQRWAYAASIPAAHPGIIGSWLGDITDQFQAAAGEFVAGLQATYSYTFRNGVIGLGGGLAFAIVLIMAGRIYQQPVQISDISSNESHQEQQEGGDVKGSQFLALDIEPEAAEPAATSDELPDIELTAETTSFQISDSSSFKIARRDKGAIDKLNKRAKQLLGGTADPPLKESISVAVINSQGSLLPEGLVTVEAAGDDSLEISVNAGEDLKPGKYQLQITYEGQIITQDFTWGVLAINTNKPAYYPGEKADIALAVLDEEGMMVCDASVELEIASENGSTVSYSTADGTITVNPECNFKDYTLKPDYELGHAVGGVGEYQMKLTAETANGSYTITDSFSVQQQIAFDIERSTATRVYPAHIYPVLISVTPERDFSGTVEELVPDRFVIAAVSERELSQLGLEADLISGLVEPMSESDREGSKKALRWQVNWQAGQTYHLAYGYDAPDESPDFYTLGPITIGNYEEGRVWQLAIDATLPQLDPTSDVSATLVVNQAGSATNIYQAIDDYVGGGSVNTADYIWGPTGNNTGADAVFEITDMPTDFSSMDTLEANIYIAAPANFSDDTAVLYARIFQSDGSTPLTNEMQIATHATTAGLQTVSFTGLVASNKTTWDGARLQLRWTYNKVRASDAGELRVAAARVNGTYTAAVADSFTGKVFTDETETTPLTSTEVCLAVNTDASPTCATTDGSGVFVISKDTAAGDQLTFYTTGGNVANTVTIADGNDIVAADNLRLYQNQVVVRHEQGTAISIADMALYDNDNNATNILYTATTGTPDTLSVESGIKLHVYSDSGNAFVFAPGGNITTQGTGGSLVLGSYATFTGASSQTHTIAGGVVINSNAALSAPSGGTINVAGDWTNNGTFTHSSGLVVFNGTSQTYGGSSTGIFNNITIDSTLSTSSNLTVNGTLTVSGSGNFSPSGGTVTLATTSWALANSGTLTFAGLTISETPTVQPTASFSVSGALTVDSTKTLAPTGGTITMATTGWTIANSGTLTFAGLTISETPTVQPSASFGVSGALTVDATKTLAPTGGTITMTGGSIVNNGGSSANLAFQGLTFTGTTTSSSDFTVNGTLTVSGSGNFSPSGGTVTLATTSWALANSGTLVFSGLTISETPTVQPSASFGVSGALTVDSTKTLAPTGGTITMTGGSIVNNGGSSANLVFQGLTFTGTTTSASNFTVNGTLTVSGSGNFSPSGGTVTLATTSWALANSGTLTFAGLTISETPTVQPSTSFSVSGAITVNSTKTLAPTGGTITMATTGWTIANNGSLTFAGLTIGETPTVQPTANFGVSGALTVNSTKTLAPTAGIITMTGGSIVNNGGSASNLAFHGLTFTGTTTSASSFEVKGDWSNSGSFTQSAGTVSFNGSGAQQISGTNNTFFGLAITGSTARTVTFTGGSTVAVASNGSLTLSGAANNLLTLQSSNTTPWNLQVSETGTTVAVSYVAVSYSNATGYKQIDATDGTSTNNLNNTN